MFSSISSNIFQNNTKMLKEQWWEMQRRHKEKQQLQAYLEEAVEAHHIEHVAQKARKVAKTKTREETKKRWPVEKEDKRKWMEYLQQLQDKVLVKNTNLLKGIKESQITESKHKKKQ